MTKFSDESLMFYADGLLDASESERLQQALTRDPKLRARLQVFRSTGRDLAALFEPHAATPLPPQLRDIVNGVGQDVAPSPVYDLRKYTRTRVWPDGWRSGTALAASVALLAGIGLGWLLRGEPAGDFASPPQIIVQADGGQLIAGDLLQRALESQPSGISAAAGPINVSVKMTFQNAAGEYCRQYQVTAPQSQHYAGMACRVDGTWRADFQAQMPPAPSAVGHAVPASGNSEIMDAVIGAAIAGDPLSAPDEAVLLSKGWAK
jgi:hypothetical protein